MHPAPGDCLCLGREPAWVKGPLLPGTPRAPLCSFPWPRGQLGPEQTGLFAYAGISRSLCSFDFLLPLCRTLLWGLQRGLGPPPFSLPLEAQVCFPCPPLPCTDILRMPTEHIWVACGDSSCATPPWSPLLHVSFPPPTAWHLWPPSAPWRSGCERLPPRSGIPGTLHPVSRGGKLGTGIRPAAQPHGLPAPHRSPARHSPHGPRRGP